MTTIQRNFNSTDSLKGLVRSAALFSLKLHTHKPLTPVLVVVYCTVDSNYYRFKDYYETDITVNHVPARYSRNPVDSIRDAVLTVSPNRQYRGIVRPTTPATTGPETHNTQAYITLEQDV